MQYSLAKARIYEPTQAKTLKNVDYVKYSTKSGYSFRFYLYLCHASQIFACFFAALS